MEMLAVAVGRRRASEQRQPECNPSVTNNLVETVQEPWSWHPLAEEQCANTVHVAPLLLSTTLLLLLLLLLLLPLLLSMPAGWWHGPGPGWWYGPVRGHG
jgi:hypothetical protein